MIGEPEKRARVKILIAEDEAIFAEDLAGTLQDLGYQVAGMASTGEMAIQLAQESEPALVLMDIKLAGDMDGIEASERIRAGLDIPIIFVTTYKEKEIMPRAKNAEPYGYIVKPFSSHILELTIDTALHKHAADKQVRESEAGYRALFENVRNGVAIYRVEGNGEDFVFVDFNKAAEAITGTPRSKVIGRRIAEVFPGVKDLSLFDVLQRTWRTGEPAHQPVKQYRDQSVNIWIENFVYKLPSGNIVAVFSDETERKRAEEALSKQLEFMTHLMEAIPLPVFFKDIDHIYLGCNNAFAQFLGLPKEKIVGRSVFDVVSHETAEIFRERDESLFRNPGTQVYATSLTRFDGSTRDVVFHKATYGSPDNPVSGLVGAILDVTDLKILQKQLLQAQKMEAIGTLAGGIAHDFNNLLQITLGYSELLLDEKREDDPEHADISKIFQAAKSGAELVQRLLTFSRKVEPQPIPLNLNRRILQVEKILRRTIPKMIDIQMDLSDELAEVHADPTQIEQVLMNLAVNARDAMSEGGILSVSTQNVTLDKVYCTMHPGAKPGDYVLLSISDTGHGMDSAIIEHIFEPFYTTKELGRGTGLGLATVYGIIEQHGGYITCCSEVGHGTVFKIYLPAIEGELESETELSGEMPAFGTETVLLVDDEESVRELGARILTKCGYTVLQAEDGREAIDLFSRERSRISLVVLDLMMPEMGGTECLKELLKIDSQVKVLVASGYSADASVKETIQMGARCFVRKPFRAKELLRDVHKVLDEG